MSHKRILVTGAAGFIGYHVALKLKQRGDWVIGYDNFNAYYDRRLKEARNLRLAGLGVEVVRGDLDSLHLIEGIVESQKITHIVHLAAQAGVRFSLDDPNAYISSNIQGFLNILEVCRAHPEIPLTYASSSSVYGLNKKVPFDVDDRCDLQASLYGVTKRSNELMAATYHHLFGIRVTGLRFFTVYGPWGRPDMAPYLFAEAILAGKPINLYNHGKMERDFTYIDDIVAGTLAAMDLEAPCEIFNLGNNTPVHLERFVAILEQSLGVAAEKRLLPMQPGDVPTTYASIEKSQRLLGYQPTTPLEKGIPLFVEWIRPWLRQEL